MHLPHFLRSGPLLARLFRAGDRVAHEIGIEVPRCAGGSDPAIEFIPLLSSVEGSPQDDWPPSPAFQHLHVERLGGREIVMLIGKTGEGHWSAAVEADGSGSILYDVACRCGLRPAGLGSSYAATQDVAAKTAALAGDVLLDPLDDALASAGSHSGGAAWRVAPPQMERTYPATVRWRYRLRLVGHPSHPYV